MGFAECKSRNLRDCRVQITNCDSSAVVMFHSTENTEFGSGPMPKARGPCPRHGAHAQGTGPMPSLNIIYHLLLFSPQFHTFIYTESIQGCQSRYFISSPFSRSSSKKRIVRQICRWVTTRPIYNHPCLQLQIPEVAGRGLRLPLSSLLSLPPHRRLWHQAAIERLCQFQRLQRQRLPAERVARLAVDLLKDQVGTTICQ